MGAAAVTARAMHFLHQGVCVPDYEKLLEMGYSRLIEPGQVVFDVGAHTARHLDRFVELVGKRGHVFGFEPMPGLASVLTRLYSGNPCVTIKQLALSDRPGSDTFRVVENLLGHSGLKQRSLGANTRLLRLPDNRVARGILRKLIQVRPFGLDNLGERARRRGFMIVREFAVQLDTIDAQAASLERLDFIKIDVEGGEMNCLRGAQATVARYRPFISIEYGHPGYSAFGETLLSLFNWAQQNRYLVSDLFGNIVEGESEWHEVCDKSYWDYYLLPDEQRDFFSSRFSF